jgi:hypothetical protein
MTDAHWTRHHFRKKRLTQYVGRGEVYSWLRAYHTEVSEMLARGELSWAMLSVEIQRAGVRGRWGESPTPKAAARVWRRVSRDVEAAAAAAVPKRKYPSRMSVDWRPEVVSQPPAKSRPGHHCDPSAAFQAGGILTVRADCGSLYGP